MTSYDALSEFPRESRSPLAEQPPIVDLPREFNGSLDGLEDLCRTTNEQLAVLQQTIGHLAATSSQPPGAPRLGEAMSEVRTLAAKVSAIETHITQLGSAPLPQSPLKSGPRETAVIVDGRSAFVSAVPRADEYLAETVTVHLPRERRMQKRMAVTRKQLNQMWEDLEEVRAAFRPMKGWALQHRSAALAVLALPVVGTALLAGFLLAGHFADRRVTASKVEQAAPSSAPAVAANNAPAPSTAADPVDLPTGALGLAQPEPAASARPVATSGTSRPSAAPLPKSQQPVEQAPEPRVPAAKPLAATAAAPKPVVKAAAPGSRYAGTLLVDSQPSGAIVRVNQQQVGTTPLKLSQKAGTHTVWIEREGYQRWTGAVLVPADKQTRLNVKLDQAKRQD